MSDPREVHELDQGFAAIRNMAAAVARYYRSLIEEGIPADLAATLALEWQAHMMGLGGLMGDADDD